MYNFLYNNPTKIYFGKGQIRNLSREIPAGSKVLLLYGGGSIKRNGVYTQVLRALADDYTVYEFGGITSNPEYSLLLDALDIINRERIDFILAVGGGSVIDGGKFLSAAALFEGGEPWDMIAERIRIRKGLPLGTVLTMPGTGSEMNTDAIISRSEIQEKLGLGGSGLYPVFSILDPEVVASIPKKQLVNGLADAYMHVLEQYMTYPVNAMLQDRVAEGILLSLIELTPALLGDAYDYDTAANFMWCCTWAQNGFLEKGVSSDWAMHRMGHELTALFGIDHARTICLLMKSHYTFNFDNKKEKLAQYAERVWGITSGTPDEKARAGIEKTIQYFEETGIKTRLSDYTDEYKGAAENIADRFRQRGWQGLGEHQNLSPDDVEVIIKNAY